MSDASELLAGPESGTGFEGRVEEEAILQGRVLVGKGKLSR